MDLADIKREAQAAREYQCVVGPSDAPRNISMRMPTEHEIKIASLRSGMRKSEDATTALLERALLMISIVGWAGVVESDVLPGLPGDPLIHAPDAITLLLDAQPGWSDDLWKGLVARLAERHDTRETAAKN